MDVKQLASEMLAKHSLFLERTYREVLVKNEQSFIHDEIQGEHYFAYCKSMELIRRHLIANWPDVCEGLGNPKGLLKARNSILNNLVEVDKRQKSQPEFHKMYRSLLPLVMKGIADSFVEARQDLTVYGKIMKGDNKFSDYRQVIIFGRKKDDNQVVYCKVDKLVLKSTQSGRTYRLTMPQDNYVAAAVDLSKGVQQDCDYFGMVLPEHFVPQHAHKATPEVIKEMNDEVEKLLLHRSKMNLTYTQVSHDIRRCLEQEFRVVLRNTFFYRMLNYHVDRKANADKLKEPMF